MNSNELRDFLKEVNNTFPLPDKWEDGSPFGGRHALGLNQETGRLELGLWMYDRDNKLVSWPVIFDEEGEDLTKDLPLDIKGMFEAKFNPPKEEV